MYVGVVEPAPRRRQTTCDLAVAAFGERIGQALRACVHALGALRFVCGSFGSRCALLHFELLALQCGQPRLRIGPVGVVLRVGDRVHSIGNLGIQIVEVAFDLGEFLFGIVGVFDRLFSFCFGELFVFGRFIAFADLFDHDKSRTDDSDEREASNHEHPRGPLLGDLGATQLQLAGEPLLLERGLMALALRRFGCLDAHARFALGIETRFFDGALMVALSPNSGLFGFAHAALSFLLLLNALFFRAANRVLFLLNAGLFDLTELAERKQH